MPKILVDTSVESAAHVLKWRSDPHTVEWGGKPFTANVSVMGRRQPRDEENERHVRALPTIARLAREKILQLVTYQELMFEGMYGRRPSTATKGDLFVNVEIGHVEPAVDRSFFEAITLPETGETDHLRRFCQQLLTPEFPWDEIVGKEIEQLPPMTVQSLKDVERFRRICQHAPPKHCPDLFHLWTGEVNCCAYFLTMERRLPNLYKSHLNAKVTCRPIQPANFVAELGVTDLDPMPCGRDGKLSFTNAVDIFPDSD